MRRTLLTAALFLLVAQTTYSQPLPTPVPEPNFSWMPVTITPSPATVRANEIQALRSDMQRLQNRLDQLSPSSAMQVDTRFPQAPELRPGSTSLPSLERPSAFICEAPSESKWPLHASWNHGLEFLGSDDSFRVHVGGNVEFDYGWNRASQTVQFGPGGIGELSDGADFRYARIRIDGTMYQHFEWVAEFDFANSVNNDSSSSQTPIGSPSFTNVWFGVNDLPWLGTLRAGWMDEPINFEHLNSIRWLNFMEKAPGVGALALTSPGILWRDQTPNERMTWAFGFFHAQNNNFGFGFGDGQYAETGRLTWLPWYEDDGAHLIHLGIGARHGHLNSNDIELRARPSVRTMPGVDEPALADTGSITATTSDSVDVELAGVWGPWTLQSEYAAIWIHDAVVSKQQLGTLFYQGAYVELLYFLTGEFRAYNRRDAVFDRVIPRRNFNIWSGEQGWGAWQVGIRYGYLDFQNKGVNGATLNDIVLGLNWFLNPNAKVQWNFAIDHRESTPPGSSGWTYIFGGRVALDF
jgi:phosphate-selective porin OprO/OprP